MQIEDAANKPSAKIFRRTPNYSVQRLARGNQYMSPEDPSELGPQQSGASAPEISIAKPATSESAAPSAPLEDRAKDYLGSLLRNIETMLAYANSNGLPLPDDLRGKIDELLNNPEVKNFSFKNRGSQNDGRSIGSRG
jgi:hypothetical protein